MDCCKKNSEPPSSQSVLPAIEERCHTLFFVIQRACVGPIFLYISLMCHDTMYLKNFTFHFVYMLYCKQIMINVLSSNGILNKKSIHFYKLLKLHGDHLVLGSLYFRNIMISVVNNIEYGHLLAMYQLLLSCDALYARTKKA